MSTGYNYGGPDAYGYYWTDDIKANVSFEDISKIGTEVSFTNVNNGAADIDLPFLFNFYGEYFNKLTVSVNGTLFLGGQHHSVNYKNRAIPSTTSPKSGIIAPFWDDLQPGSNGKVYYKNFDVGPRKFIIQWDKWEWYRSSMNGHTATFQVWLLPESISKSKRCDIYFLYKEFTGGRTYRIVNSGSPAGDWSKGSGVGTFQSHWALSGTNREQYRISSSLGTTEFSGSGHDTSHLSSKTMYTVGIENRDGTIGLQIPGEASANLVSGSSIPILQDGYSRWGLESNYGIHIYPTVHP